MAKLSGEVFRRALLASSSPGLPALSLGAAAAVSKIYARVPELPGVNVFRRAAAVVPSDSRYPAKPEGSVLAAEQAAPATFAQTLRDASVAYQSRTVPELLRAIAVFETCRVPWIVKNAENLLDTAGNVSRKVTDAVVKKTFFAQFCAGENEEEVKPFMTRLRSSNVGAILDYAAEADISSVQAQGSAGSLYSMETEAHCDGNLAKYLKAIALAEDGNAQDLLQQGQAGMQSLQGVVSIKVTALANPALLERLSAVPEEDLAAEEQSLAVRAQERCLELGAAARRCGVRLLVDAEQSYFQPAIDALALKMMRECNGGAGGPVVFNTYQCYLKDSHGKLKEHRKLSDREGWHLGAKLVRGAYMHSERERARELGYPSPVHETIEDTHDSYDRSVNLMLGQVKHGRAQVVVASHNEQSILEAIKTMAKLDLPSTHGGVIFGQLQGMCDFLTYSLSAKGYKAYKLLPYGPLHEVMPYLIRRAQENSGVLANTNIEKALMMSEVKRRITPSRPYKGFAASISA